MTIQEAMKSGKPFRRRDWTFWVFMSPSFRFIVEKDDIVRTTEITPIHFLADDWEVKQ